MHFSEHLVRINCNQSQACFMYVKFYEDIAKNEIVIIMLQGQLFNSVDISRMNGTTHFRNMIMNSLQIAYSMLIFDISVDRHEWFYIFCHNCNPSAS